MDYRDSAIGAINRGLFLAPESTDDYDDPLVQQALRNIDDIVEEAKARKAARILALHEAEKHSASPQHRQQKHQKQISSETAHELRDIVGTLVPLLGRRYTALIGGAAATGTIADWVAAKTEPTGEYMTRLRLAYRVARILRSRLDDASLRQWFLAQNEMLNGESPVLLLAMRNPTEVSDTVLGAAASAADGH